MHFDHLPMPTEDHTVGGALYSVRSVDDRFNLKSMRSLSAGFNL